MSNGLHDDAPGDSRERIVELIAASQQMLTGYLRALVMDFDAADDILQETNVVLWRKADQYDPTRKFTTWACRIASYQAMAYLRDRRRDRHQFIDEALLTDLAGRAAEQAEQLESRVRALRQCMGKLTDHQRELIRSRYRPGGSVQQLAEQRGRSAGALSVQLSRIRRKLHDCITAVLNVEAL